MFSPVVNHVVEKIKSTEMVLMQPEVGPFLNVLRVFTQNKDIGQVALSFAWDWDGSVLVITVVCNSC